MAARSPLDILKLLPNTNCAECGERTCLAFATKVINKNRRLADCPHLDATVAVEHDSQVTTQMTAEEKQQERLEKLRLRIRDVDLEERAGALGGRYSPGSDELTINCLGKEFSVDSGGRISSQCHTHAWFSIPFLSYILFGNGTQPSGDWVTFRNLRNGTDWDAFFDEQCTFKLQRLADTHDELFGNLISAFGASMAARHLDADISVILHPFPKVPLMVCYWKPDGDLDSDLRVFFDRTADQNLGTEASFGLATGIVRMLEKISEKHV